MLNLWKFARHRLANWPALVEQPHVLSEERGLRRKGGGSRFLKRLPTPFLPFVRFRVLLTSKNLYSPPVVCTVAFISVERRKGDRHI